MAKKNTIRYTAADILRYHSGAMSNSEMHSLEKAALEDLFLADAIEGYIKTKTAEKDIEEIKRRFSKKEQKKIFSIKQFDNAWTRIAALLIVILGIGYYTFQANRKPGSIATARNIDTTSVKKDQVIIVPKTDTISPGEVITAQKTDNTRNYKERLEGIRTRNKKDFESQGGQSKKADSLNDVAKNDIAVLAPQSDKAQGKISALRDSGITAMQLKVATREKSKPDRALSIDSNQNQRGSSMGYSISKKVLRDNNTIDTISVYGSESFRNYIAKNKRIITDNTTYKGDIILSFNVNKKGRPEKIIVEQSPCPKCNQQAIKLLKQGPDWEYSKRERKKVIINL